MTRLPIPASDVLNQKLTILDPSFLILFEIVLALVSITTIITSSMVIHHILESKKKFFRINSMFVILSISDIAVGVFSLPVHGIF